MLYKTKKELTHAEEIHKEKVYQELDRLRDSAHKAFVNQQADVDRGAYDDHDAFMSYGQLTAAKNRKYEIEQIITKLYKKPYFAHIETLDEEDGNSEHFYLSNSEDLDTIINIGTDGILFPFKKDAKRPISIAIHHCYHYKDGKPISYIGNGGKYTLIPQLICDDEIYNRRLVKPFQLYPEPEFVQITEDELLEERLQDNRNNPTFRNIIATLQRMQFQIVAADTDTSFVVQGCAGSGKSQCIIHRLFFLRDELSDKGWDKVLLITPTQFFRNYSAGLMRRFHLSDVANISISELYRSLLYDVDPRFRNRQYDFMLSEEYLPDGYLHQVYSAGNIKRIREEITSAITNHVSEGCRLLDIDLAEDKIDYIQVNEISRALGREIEDFDSVESKLANDEEFIAKRSEMEKAEKDIEKARKTSEERLDRIEELEKRRREFERLKDELKSAEDEISNFERQNASEIESLRKEAEAASKELNGATIKYSNLPQLYDYCRKLAEYLDATKPWGEKKKKAVSQLEFLTGYAELCREDLKQFIKDKTAGAWANANAKEIAENEEKLKNLGEEISLNEMIIAENSEWLQKHSEDLNLQNQNKARRSQLEKARYYLSRIESAVFEQEVWDALAPLKEKCGIKTINVELLPDGKKKETRILYKSDLLFYLRIYMALNEFEGIPDYRYICIDEGQDLHKADYETLMEIYPNAVFNVFGDTAQALHVDCGIQDWKTETGIESIYELTTNYRNTPATVQFCEERFNVNMKACGKVNEEQRPKELYSGQEIISLLSDENVTVIVKDKEAFDELNNIAGAEGRILNYIDTNSTEENENKISCYSIYAAKGLEFPNVFVFAKNMTLNQKVVACTRALNKLYYFE